MAANYDYEELKAATAALDAAAEEVFANTKDYKNSGADLIEGNDAPGVKSTMDESVTQNEELDKVVLGATDKIKETFETIKALHASSGGAI